MKSHLSNNFLKYFNKLPERIKKLARRNYRLWEINPYHPSLHFKEVKKGTNIYSVRIGIGWRAIGIIKDDNIIWFWIGSHNDYDNFLSELMK